MGLARFIFKVGLLIALLGQLGARVYHIWPQHLEIQSVRNYQNVLQQHIGVALLSVHVDYLAEVLQQVVAAVQSVALPHVLHQLVREELDSRPLGVLAENRAKNWGKLVQIRSHRRQIGEGLSQIFSRDWHSQHHNGLPVQGILCDVQRRVYLP